MARGVLTRYSSHTDDSGAKLLSFADFQGMLTAKPWSRLLPSSHRDAVLMENRQAYSQQERAASPERSQARQMSTLARQLFESSDLDASGLVDAEELAILIQKLFKQSGQALPADVRIRLCEDVNRRVEELAHPGNDGLDFNQFSRLLTMAPWCDVLPAEICQELKFKVLKQGFSTQKESPPEESSEIHPVNKGASSGEMVLADAMKFFKEADTDDSGLIDQDELVMVVEKLSAQLGGADEVSAALDLRRHAKAAMAKFSSDGNTLSFSEFVSV